MPLDALHACYVENNALCAVQADRKLLKLLSGCCARTTTLAFSLNQWISWIVPYRGLSKVRQNTSIQRKLFARPCCWAPAVHCRIRHFRSRHSNSVPEDARNRALSKRTEQIINRFNRAE